MSEIDEAELLGAGQRGAVLSLYFVGAVGGCAAILASYLPLRGALAVCVIVVVLAILAIVKLERAPYERQAPDETASLPRA